MYGYVCILMNLARTLYNIISSMKICPIMWLVSKQKPFSLWRIK